MRSYRTLFSHLLFKGIHCGECMDRETETKRERESKRERSIRRFDRRFMFEMGVSALCKYREAQSVICVRVLQPLRA